MFNVKLEADAWCSAQHGLGRRADRLAPAEGFLNALANALAAGITSEPSTDGVRSHLRTFARMILAIAVALPITSAKRSIALGPLRSKSVHEHC